MSFLSLSSEPPSVVSRVVKSYAKLDDTDDDGDDGSSILGGRRDFQEEKHRSTCRLHARQIWLKG